MWSYCRFVRQQHVQQVEVKFGFIDLRIRSCSASDSVYSYTFLRIVICLPVVCLSNSCNLQQTENRTFCPVLQTWLRTSHCADYYYVTSLFKRIVTCPCHAKIDSSFIIIIIKSFNEFRFPFGKYILCQNGVLDPKKKEKFWDQTASQICNCFVSPSNTTCQRFHLLPTCFGDYFTFQQADDNLTWSTAAKKTAWWDRKTGSGSATIRNWRRPSALLRRTTRSEKRPGRSTRTPKSHVICRSSHSGLSGQTSWLGAPYSSRPGISSRRSAYDNVCVTPPPPERHCTTTHHKRDNTSLLVIKGALTCVAVHSAWFPYGRWRYVALGWAFHKELYQYHLITRTNCNPSKIVPLDKIPLLYAFKWSSPSSLS